MMPKKFCLILIALIFVFGISTVAAIDYVPIDPGTTTSTTALYSQLNSAFSSINAKIDSVQQSSNQCFKTSEIDLLKEKLNEQWAKQTQDFLSQILILFLFFTLFFFAFMFLAKAKRWF